MRERAAELAWCPPRGPDDVVRTAARAAEIRIMQRHGRGMQYQQVWNQNVPHEGLDLDDADDDDGNPIGRTAYSFHLVDKAAWLETNAPPLGGRATSGPSVHYTRDSFSAQNDAPFDAKQLASSAAAGVWLARPKTASDAQFEAEDARRRATRARPSARARMERAQIAAATAPLTLRDLTGGVPDRPQTAPVPLGSPDSRGGHADTLGQPNLNLNLNRNPEVRSARRINALTPSLMAFERVPSRGSIARFHKVERAATRERMKESRSIHSQLTAKRVQEQIQRAGFRPLQRKAAPSETQLGTMPGARPMRATPGVRSYDQSKKAFSLVKYDV